MSKKLDRLAKIVRRLRGPKGCPWDKKQTHKSLKPHLIEESYEVIEAIDKENYSEMCEELGDLLLQVVLHSQLAREKKKFNLDNVIDGISRKLLRRHPHVFSANGKKVKNIDELFKRWEKIKNMEHEGDKSTLAGVPKSLPALARAESVQAKSARAGFDWDKVLKRVKKGQTIKEQIGYLLFAAVDISRKLDINAEDALQTATSKFVKEFKTVEKHLHI